MVEKICFGTVREIHMVIVFVVTCVLIALVLLLLGVRAYQHREPFTTTTEGVALSTNALQHRTWLRQRRLEARSVPFRESQWEDDAQRVRRSPTSFATTSNITFIADPLDARTFFDGVEQVATSPKGYFVAMFNPSRALHVDCSYNFAQQRVGYLDRSDFLFIKAIMSGYRMTPPERLEHIPMEKWDQLETLLYDFDVIVAFIIPNSDLHRVLMKQQVSVMGFRNLDIDRVRLFYPFVTLENVQLNVILQDVPGAAMLIMDKEKDTFLPSMTMPLLRLVGNIRIAEGFSTQGTFTLTADPTATDPSYRCYGDLSIEQKHLCESPYDVIGMPKRRPTVWDRPCVRNEDCPFYKANQNYRNARGGCLRGGICEMPIGIKRTAYRSYIADGIYAPFCYGCDAPTDPLCCSRQTNPDYAFANDREARMKAGAGETIMAMK